MDDDVEGDHCGHPHQDHDHHYHHHPPHHHHHIHVPIDSHSIFTYICRYFPNFPHVLDVLVDLSPLE